MKRGGTLHSPVGVLGIDEVEQIEEADITAADARRAGAVAVDDVIGALRFGEGRRLYRIRFHRIGDDPRAALRRDADLSDVDRNEIAAQLDRWDTASRTGPWTTDVLEAIEEHPAQPSKVLAAQLAVEQQRFKRRVRQLKGLGLTESLEKGYRLSPRGEAYRRRP